jgi:hypothetical protein
MTYRGVWTPCFTAMPTRSEKHPFARPYYHSSIMTFNGSCPRGTSTHNQVVDFHNMGQDECLIYLREPTPVACQQDSTWLDYDAEYSLLGGAWTSPHCVSQLQPHYIYGLSALGCLA